MPYRIVSLLIAVTAFALGAAKQMNDSGKTPLTDEEAAQATV